MATAVVQSFHRDSWAEMYAQRHLATDPGIQEVCYLPDDSPDDEIRLVEINDLMAVRETDQLEPIDFGVDIGGTHPHRLFVLDITPHEWEQVKTGSLSLPSGWSTKRIKVYRPKT